MTELDVKIINRSHHPLPAYETPGAAGMDVRAYLQEPIVLNPGERVLVPTGLYMQLPQGYECQIRPRSGLALKYGITIANSPGTIDCDYRGEIKVILLNQSNQPFTINDGERVCQMVIAAYERVKWNSVERIDSTERGDGGFGHTGTE
ncbi:MAG: dUTP diphosphatase [Muribaculaceae bacterium]|nr:dUTP diphosphatase [Muribaculaceae bacterium]MDE5968890.1 dUTP diphosphatase [Muribaculaceae bacterium]MDE7393992.1 dUTP diphosphatase [Muribaculaceae bacterium]